MLKAPKRFILKNSLASPGVVDKAAHWHGVADRNRYWIWREHAEERRQIEIEMQELRRQRSCQTG
jgi:hypothetical protein